MNKNWKTAFFALLGLELAALGVLVFFIWGQRPQLPQPKTAPSSVELAMNGDQLEGLVNGALAERGIEGQLNIDGAFTFTWNGELMPLVVTGLPEARDGHLILQVSSISAGGLPLPREWALKLGQNFQREGLYFNGDATEIVLDLSALAPRGLELYALELSQEADRYTFLLNLNGVPSP
ncbi:MAG: DUF2140 family protein [Tissierellia bacterium]|nr:DUF2140 family protein [Tissierellia bacterium]